ncbi:unnamed protein product, partial [Pleuronectes platessa]
RTTSSVEEQDESAPIRPSRRRCDRGASAAKLERPRYHWTSGISARHAHATPSLICFSRYTADRDVTSGSFVNCVFEKRAGLFDVFHRDSSVRSLLKAHDVIENN